MKFDLIGIIELGRTLCMEFLLEIDCDPRNYFTREENYALFRETQTEKHG